MTSALRWAAMRAILMFRNCEKGYWGAEKVCVCWGRGVGVGVGVGVGG